MSDETRLDPATLRWCIESIRETIADPMLADANGSLEAGQHARHEVLDDYHGDLRRLTNRMVDLADQNERAESSRERAQSPREGEAGPNASETGRETRQPEGDDPAGAARAPTYARHRWRGIPHKYRPAFSVVRVPKGA